jgi:hypothetical protein
MVRVEIQGHGFLMAQASGRGTDDCGQEVPWGASTVEGSAKSETRGYVARTKGRSGRTRWRG